MKRGKHKPVPWWWHWGGIWSRGFDWREGATVTRVKGFRYYERTWLIARDNARRAKRKPASSNGAEKGK